MKPKVSGSAEGELIALKLEQIEAHPDVTNIRGHNTDDAYLGDRERLRTNIQSNGIRTYPIVVRELTASGVKYYLADGFRRVACARDLAKKDARFRTVTCVVREGSVLDVYLENTIAGIGQEPTRTFAIAMRAHVLHQDAGRSIADLVEMLGIGERAVQYYLKTVANTIPEIRSQALRGMVQFTALRDLVAVHPVAVQLEISKVIAEHFDPKKKNAARTVRNAIREYVDKRVAGSKPDSEPLDLTTPPKKGAQTAKKGPSKSTKPKVEVAASKTPETPVEPPAPIKKPTKAAVQPEQEKLQAMKARAERVATFVDFALSGKLDMEQAIQDLGIEVKDETPDQAALYGVIEGLFMAVSWITGATCPQCGEAQVAFNDIRLPAVHSCEE